MFPLKDENPTEIFPLFTMAIIATCVGVWVYVQGAGLQAEALLESICSYGAIPAEFTGATGEADGVRLGRDFVCSFGGPTWSTLVTSVFLHGSWMHLIGNMWFLWIFGNNVEDSMGHLRFLVFFLLTGAVAAGSHILAEPSSPLPMVGASGAVSAIMGAYMLLYPGVRVKTLFIIVIFIYIVSLPAWIFLGYWLLLQLVASTIPTPAGAGGIAFWAHIGGFLAGLLLIKPFSRPELVDAKRRQIRLARSQIRNRGWW